MNTFSCLVALVLATAAPKESIRFTHIDEQQRDASCGYAVLSTLISKYAEGPETHAAGPETHADGTAVPATGPGSQATAPSISPGVPGVGETGLIGAYPPEGEREGISFALMRRILSDYGIDSCGYSMTYGQLESALGIYAPVIVHFDSPTDHFALALATLSGYCLIGDPAEGIVLYGKSSFLRSWSGMVLVPAIDAHRRFDDLKKIYRRRTLIVDRALSSVSRVSK